MKNINKEINKLDFSDQDICIGIDTFACPFTITISADWEV